MELLASSQPFMIGLNGRGSNDGKGANAHDGEKQAEGSEVHSFEMQTFVTPCEGRAMREKAPRERSIMRPP